ncbi:MAG: cytochrome c biogenesis CcdA family protein [Paracoccaceae bacterium]
MDPILAYLAGLLTLINPCVLPVLPIVIMTALQASPRGPLALVLGLSLSFVAVGVLVTAFGYLVGINTWVVERISAVLMVLFGLALMVPRAAGVIEHATAGLSRRADAQMETLDRDALGGQFWGGVLLGAVWSPCIGPTLGGAILLASQGESLLWAAMIMAGFAAGVSTFVLALAYGARHAMGDATRRLAWLGRSARPALGATFALLGLVMLLGLHKQVEVAILSTMPYWWTDLSALF